MKKKQGDSPARRRAQQRMNKQPMTNSGWIIKPAGYYSVTSKRESAGGPRRSAAVRGGATEADFRPAFRQLFASLSRSRLLNEKNELPRVSWYFL